MNARAGARREPTMKIAVYGGSFNPPHVAHLMVCAYTLAVSDADKVLVIPCARHPFAKDLAPFRHRYEMCRLAVDGVLDRVEVSDIDGRRDGPSYMIDTLEALLGEYPAAAFELIIGDDVVGETDDWKDFDRVRAMAEVRVVPRLGPESLDKATDSERFVLPEVSSTRIRERLASADAPKEHVPRRVLDYIERHGLYR